jgi:hypothetical protein
MTKIEQVIAGICLTVGCVFLSIPVAVSFEAQPTSKDRGAAWGGLILGLPPTMWGLYLVKNTKQRRRLDRDWFEFEDRELDLMFVDLLTKYQGSITILQLAKSSNLTIDEAKFYLDFKAIQLNGDYEIADNGGIVYHFPIV